MPILLVEAKYQKSDHRVPKVEWYERGCLRDTLTVTRKNWPAYWEKKNLIIEKVDKERGGTLLLLLLHANWGIICICTILLIHKQKTEEVVENQCEFYNMLGFLCHIWFSRQYSSVCIHSQHPLYNSLLKNHYYHIDLNRENVYIY